MPATTTTAIDTTTLLTSSQSGDRPTFTTTLPTSFQSSDRPTFTTTLPTSSQSSDRPIFTTPLLGSTTSVNMSLSTILNRPNSAFQTSELNNTLTRVLIVSTCILFLTSLGLLVTLICSVTRKPTRQVYGRPLPTLAQLNPIYNPNYYFEESGPEPPIELSVLPPPPPSLLLDTPPLPLIRENVMHLDELTQSDTT